jgi:hypothetical protein
LKKYGSGFQNDSFDLEALYLWNARRLIKPSKVKQKKVLNVFLIDSITDLLKQLNELRVRILRCLEAIHLFTCSNHYKVTRFYCKTVDDLKVLKDHRHRVSLIRFQHHFRRLYIIETAVRCW